jgi:hypothetical protein
MKKQTRIRKGDPWPFLFAAAKLPGKALHVANALLWLALEERSRLVEWEPDVGAELGLNRQCAHRGLKALEAAGLVSVDRKHGRRPIVTILETKVT